MPPTKMFVAIYSGATISEAKIVGASAHPQLVQLVYEAMRSTLKPIKNPFPTRAELRAIREAKVNG